uniref:Uncharacterized protein n=1 Tax=Oryza brachyantha TaxID=4533 RepID=J3MXN2_ORYBR
QQPVVGARPLPRPPRHRLPDQRRVQHILHATQHPSTPATSKPNQGQQPMQCNNKFRGRSISLYLVCSKVIPGPRRQECRTHERNLSAGSVYLLPIDSPINSSHTRSIELIDDLSLSWPGSRSGRPRRGGAVRGSEEEEDGCT